MARPRKTLRVKLAGLPKDAGTVIHLWLHAYCVAKPAPYCAVFACPPQVNRFTGEEYGGSEMVQNPTAKQCEVGKWYTVAYCSREGCSQPYAVPYQGKARR